MVHAAGHDVAASHVKVSAEDLVSVALDAAIDGDAVVGLDVPQSQVMIFGHGKEQVGIARMELELVNALPMTHVVLDAVHTGWTEHSDDPPGPGRGQDGLASVRFVAPCAGVKVFVCVRVGVALHELVVAVSHGLVNGDAVVAYGGEDGGLGLVQMMVDADAENWLTVIFLPEPCASVIAGRLLLSYSSS